LESIGNGSSYKKKEKMMTSNGLAKKTTFSETVEQKGNSKNLRRQSPERKGKLQMMTAAVETTPQTSRHPENKRKLQKHEQRKQSAELTKCSE
jgi:hypothetical protein